MNLHLDEDAFKVLINTISTKTGYRADVLEKDYYVVLVLEELSQNQKAGLPAYFKGGTALYKAIRFTSRAERLRPRFTGFMFITAFCSVSIPKKDRRAQ